MKDCTKEELRYAFVKSVPVLCGYLFLGVAFGILMQTNGYNFVWVFFASLLVYAGSLQFVMVPLLVTAVSPLTMAVTTLFVNGRHLFYGLSFVESFDKMKEKLYMIFSLTDETYSVLCGCRAEDPQEEHRSAWFWLSALDHCYWVAGSVAGALLGQVLPFDFTGIDFAMTALFVVILMEQVLGKAVSVKLAAATGLVVALVCLALFGSDHFLLPALLITVVLLGGTGLRSNRKGETAS